MSMLKIKNRCLKCFCSQVLSNTSQEKSNQNCSVPSYFAFWQMSSWQKQWAGLGRGKSVAQFKATWALWDMHRQVGAILWKGIWYYPFHLTEIWVTEQKMLALYMGSSCKPQGKVVKVFCGMCSSLPENNQCKWKCSFQINALCAFNSFAEI